MKPTRPQFRPPLTNHERCAAAFFYGLLAATVFWMAYMWAVASGW